jgi:hypothetical protein
MTALATRHGAANTPQPDRTVDKTNTANSDFVMMKRWLPISCEKQDT